MPFLSGLRTRVFISLYLVSEILTLTSICQYSKIAVYIFHPSSHRPIFQNPPKNVYHKLCKNIACTICHPHQSIIRKTITTIKQHFVTNRRDEVFKFNYKNVKKNPYIYKIHTRLYTHPPSAVSEIFTNTRDQNNNFSIMKRNFFIASLKKNLLYQQSKIS